MFGVVGDPRGMQRSRRAYLAAFLAAVALSACGSSVALAPDPRPLVNRQGARLVMEPERAQEAYLWVDEEILEIQQNPTFWVITQPSTADLLPWETLDVTPSGDSATVLYPRSAPDLAQVYQIYAHFGITEVRGTIGEWLPGADTLSGWDLELAKVDRLAEAWLLGRASFSFAPYEPMDAITYAAEGDMLEPLLLSLRGFEFPEVRDAWLEANPEGEAEFREWYRRTLGRDPEPIGSGD